MHTYICYLKNCANHCHVLVVTPLDVVKIRLQAQQQAKAKCFLYCNGLMDHICSCTSDWYRRPGHFNGTIVSNEHGLTLLHVRQVMCCGVLGCTC